MKTEEGSRNKAGKVLTAVLALSVLLAGAEAGAQEKNGATVIVTLKSGHQTNGELLAVRPGSILILRPPAKDVSIDLAEVRSIRVLRSSKVGNGILIGLLVGAGGGYAGGAIYAKSSGMCPGCEAPLARAGMGMLGGIVGIVGGAIAGASAGRDLDIALDDPSAPSYPKALGKLKKYARIRSFR